LQVANKVDAVPASLADFNLTLGADGHELIYDYDTQAERTGVATLLGELSKAGVRIRDLHTSQSSLEEIFVGLVREPRGAP
jgi:ABC-2 type transport system ATP-binding protein